MAKHYEHIDFHIPKEVQEAAREGLELHEKYHRGGTDVGMETARMLSHGGEVEPEKARHIAAYFPRHTARDRLDKTGKDGEAPSNGWIAFQLWGGKAGQEWSSKLVKQMNEQDKHLDR